MHLDYNPINKVATEITPYWFIPLVSMLMITILNKDSIPIEKNFLFATMVVISAIALPHCTIVKN